MAYGFNNNKEKVDVLPKGDIVVITTSVTVPAGETAYVTLQSQELQAAGMEDGNPNKYILIGIEYKDNLDNRWMKNFKVHNNVVYPSVGVIPFGGGTFEMRIHCYNSGESEKTYPVRAMFMKVSS
ncbi:MAG: hypothetical protein IKE85_06250 [Mogibacterium sp.]|nr:hypothetical protein [Mogibacterium sp.]